MYNTVPVNGWPQIKALEGVDNLPASIDSRIEAIEDWIESVAPTQATRSTPKRGKKVKKNAE